MRFVALHYHILKNAGTTIENLLERSFGDDFGRFDSADRDSQFSADQLLPYLEMHPRLRAVTSHQLRFPKPVATGYVFFDLCFLRDPVDRIRSMYTYFRGGVSESDALCRLAHSNSLGAFIARLINDYPHIANNAQVNMLATDGAYCRPPGPAHLERAVQAMLEMSFPGVVDCFDESILAGQYYWQPAFPDFQILARPANVSAPVGSTLEQRLREVRQACEKRVFRDLLALNELDLELVSQARSEVRRRVRLVPEHERRMRALHEAKQRLAGGAGRTGSKVSFACRCADGLVNAVRFTGRLPH